MNYLSIIWTYLRIRKGKPSNGKHDLSDGHDKILRKQPKDIDTVWWCDLHRHHILAKSQIR